MSKPFKKFKQKSWTSEMQFIHLQFICQFTFNSFTSSVSRKKKHFEQNMKPVQKIGGKNSWTSEKQLWLGRAAKARYHPRYFVSRK